MLCGVSLHDTAAYWSLFLRVTSCLKTVRVQSYMKGGIGFNTQAWTCLVLAWHEHERTQTDS